MPTVKQRIDIMPLGKPTFPTVLALDAARAGAAFVVFLTHARGGTWVDYGSLAPDQQTWLTFVFFFVTRLGHEAVLIFFVLSGFLVGGRLIERVGARSFRILGYTLDRVTRILVPLVPACIFTTAINGSIFGEPINLGQTVANMIGLNHGVIAGTLDNNAPLWSLAYEIWFYIAGGAVAALIVGLRPIPAFLAFCLSGLVLSKLGEPYVVFWTLGAFGIYITKAPYKRLLFLAGAIAAATGIIFYQLGSGSKSIPVFTLLPLKIGEGLVCIGFCLCLPALCSARLNFWLAPLRGIITFASAMSYSLYLFHYPVLGVLTSVVPAKYARIDHESLSVFALKISVTLAVCVLFYFAFERNTQKIRAFLKAKLTPERAGRPNHSRSAKENA
jgi:peptidoglycan/LPS O-acetylase OafA/YrhL